MPKCLFCYQDAENDFHERCSRAFFGTSAPPTLELNDEILKDLATQTINKRIAVTGVQPKLSLSLQKNKNDVRLTIVGLWGEYILKPQQKRYLMMPENEDLTMHLASLFKIPVCAHCLIKTTNETYVYLAKRFDRLNGTKVHIEDFCQLSGFLTENKYKSSYEKAGKLILKYCVNEGIDALTYFELVLFSYLTGNNDMHLKNFSLLHGEDGICLSPAYDLLNVNLINPKDEDDLALTLNGKKKKLKADDFALLAKTLKIPERACQNIIKKFLSLNSEVDALINSSFLINEEKEKYKQIWLHKQKIFL